MVHIVNGDLMKAKEDIIGHQVNCYTMGSGVALQIKQNFPEAFELHEEACKENKDNPSKLLGACQVVYCSHNRKIIMNLFGQEKYGKDKNTVYTDYKALFNALKDLKAYAKHDGLSIALPYKIGCDRGNGDWCVVLSNIIDIFDDYEVTLYRRNQ